MVKFHTIDDVVVEGRRVLVRVDVNVPMRDGKATDMTRIVSAAKTLDALAKKGGRVIVLSHLGRPAKKIDPAFSLSSLCAPLTEALGGRHVAFASDCIGPVAAAAVASLRNGEILLLENVRFHPGEEENDSNFTAALAMLGDIYVNDAFATAHRSNASTVGLASYMPAYAGYTMQRELEMLERVLGTSTDRNEIVAVVGGSKVSTKIDILLNLVKRVGALCIGGAMANTFLLSHGISVGSSLVEPGCADLVEAIENSARKAGTIILLPVDAAVAVRLEAGAANSIVPVENCPQGQSIFDIGPRSVEAFVARFRQAKTLVWNGPLGAFEIPPFNEATKSCAQAAAELTSKGSLVTVAGGGDTVSALTHSGVAGRFSYISTAGGAFLEWLEGRELPGVRALNQERL